MAEKKKMDPVSEAALETVNAERLQQENADQEQASREQRIAECHQVIGRIQGAKMVSDFGNVAGLVWLKEVRETKIYKDIPNIGTWEKLCESIGISRRKVEEDLLNLETFGEEFLGNVAGFRVGYRDLRKLRQLSHEGQVYIDDNAVLIGGEAIPLDADHKDDLQAALASVIEAKDADLRTKDRLLKDKQKLIETQSRELSRLEVEAERKGLSADEDAFLKYCDASRITIDGFLMKFDPEVNPLPEDATPRMEAALMETLGYFRRIINAAYDTAADRYGDPTVDDSWVPPNLRTSETGEE
ncbi:MAG TPA: hypothetical protein VJ995_00345 [Geothermobacteraceae bacterium]|nr:hypothetical protein [Geothermobacteraceae bacterium]